MFLNENFQKKINLGLIIVSFIINLISLFFLPDQLGIHINSNGEFDGYISKYIGIFMIPMIMLLITFVSKTEKVDLSKKFLYILSNIILFILNGYILYINLSI